LALKDGAGSVSNLRHQQYQNFNCTWPWYDLSLRICFLECHLPHNDIPHKLTVLI